MSKTEANTNARTAEESPYQITVESPESYTEFREELEWYERCCNGDEDANAFKPVSNALAGKDDKEISDVLDDVAETLPKARGNEEWEDHGVAPWPDKQVAALERAQALLESLEGRLVETMHLRSYNGDPKTSSVMNIASSVRLRVYKISDGMYAVFDNEQNYGTSICAVGPGWYSVSFTRDYEAWVDRELGDHYTAEEVKEIRND